MIISVKPKALIFPLILSMMVTVTLLWPTHALADAPICKNESDLNIPDAPGRNVPGVPVTSTLTLNNPTLINDLNVIISTTHTYVGDLVFTLTHKVNPTITSTVIISRPLKGQSILPHEVSCSGDDIFITLDDEAVADVQVNCAEGANEGDGTKAYSDGQSYRPYHPLNIFDTDTLSGTWELMVTDNYQFDEGSLVGWCLVPNPKDDLQIYKSAIPSHAVQGQPLTYTISFKNLSGSQTATNVVITDPIPLSFTNPTFSSSGPLITRTPGLTYEWQVANLAPGQVGTITITGTLLASLTGGTNFNNLATITTSSVETNTLNNSSQATVYVQSPNLQISKNDGGITATAGALITYTLSYANIGGKATGVIITENLPNNTTFNAAASTSGWQKVGATNQYTYSVGSLSTGSGQVTFAVTVNNPLPVGTTAISNTVTIADNGTNGADLYSGDNTASTTTPVVAGPGTTLLKTYLPIILK